MAVASWLLGGRRRNNNTGRHENVEDFVQLDSNKDASENMYDILRNVTLAEGISEGRRLSYLVNFVKLVTKVDVNYDDFGYTAEEILYCLRPLSFHTSAQLKNASFRAVRHFIKTEHHVDLYIKLKFDFLVARQITAAGIQLCRRVLCVCPSKFTSAPVQAMIALTHPYHSDNLQATALAFLAELAVLNPDVFVSCGGVSSIIRNLPYLKPKMTEALIAPLLFLINKPETRDKAGINLHCLTDPVFMDRTLSFKSGGDGVRFSTTALVCLLRSWPGLLHLGQGSATAISSIVNTLYISHLQRVMLSALYEVFSLTAPDWTDDMAVALDAVDPHRWQAHFTLSEGFLAAEALAIHPHLAKARVNLVEVHLSLVLRTLLEANLLDAIVHVIVSDDTFKSVHATILLGELLGLVHKWLPAEVTKLLPGLPNLISYSIRGRPVTTSTQPTSQSPADSSLFDDTPPDGGATDDDGSTSEQKRQRQHSHHHDEKEGWSMSSLLDVFSRRFSGEGESLACAEKRSRAQTAVRALARLSSVKRDAPCPSLYLSELMSTITPVPTQLPTLSGCIEECIKESGVLSMKDPLTWNWDTIQAVLKMGCDGMPKSGDSNKKSFLRRLVNFYLPGVGRFSKIPASADKKSTSKLSLAALDLISLLLSASPESDSGSLVIELLSGIKSCIVEILSSKSAHDCFLSPHACSNTHSRDYFLILGRFTRSSDGRQALDKTHIYPVLTDLIMTTNHDCYIKLIVSGLDYGQDENARKLLGKALESKSESGRMYVTRLLHGLLRIGVTGQLREFVFYLLVLQLEDEKKSVAEYAISVLHEASDFKGYVECLVNQSPGLVRLGDQGHLLMVRLLSTPAGFKQMQQANFVNKQLDKWASHFNYRYVGLVEGMLNDGMTQTSSYSAASNRWQESGRSSSPNPRELFLPPHLYQQLCSHSSGRTLTLAHPHIPKLIQIVVEGKCGNDSEILSVKAALYALSGIVVYLDQSLVTTNTISQHSVTCGDDSATATLTTDHGVQTHTAARKSVVTGERLVAAMIDLATRCPVYSVRAVAYIALNNVASTPRGVQLIANFNWRSVSHDRHERWPLVLSDSLSLLSDSTIKHADDSSDTSSELNKSNSLIEEMILEDESSNEFFWGVPGGKTQRMREGRCATLPPASGGGATAGSHYRSYSESKADQANESEYKMDWSGRKTRSNSYTDSSTSADSYYNMRHHSFSERRPGLSPIQSVGSLSTLRQSTRRFNILTQSAALHNKLKKSSESVLKTLAQPSPYPDGLITYGDLLRLDFGTPSRLEASTLDPEDADFSLIESEDCRAGDSHDEQVKSSSTTSTSVHVTPHTLTIRPPPYYQPPQHHSTPDEKPGGCGKMVSCGIAGDDSHKEQIYLGICMPDRLSCLFPKQDRLCTNNHVAFVAKVLHSQCLEDLKNPYFHREICFLGNVGDHNTMVSTSESDSGGYMMTGSDIDLEKEPLQDNDSDSDFAADIPYPCQPMPAIFRSPLIIRSEILRMVEQLSNPLLHKTCKQSLLLMKQAHREVFREICVLSDVCYILSVCHVRVMSRELIHDLFDSGWDTVWQHARSYLAETNDRKGFNSMYCPGGGGGATSLTT